MCEQAGSAIVWSTIEASIFDWVGWPQMHRFRGFFLGFLTSCGFRSDLPHAEFCPGVNSVAALEAAAVKSGSGSSPGSLRPRERIKLEVEQIHCG